MIRKKKISDYRCLIKLIKPYKLDITNPKIEISETDECIRFCVYKMLNNKKVTFIAINKEVCSDIIKDYDLDVCKNYFDGEKIYIKNIEKILKKKDNVSIEHFIERIEKFRYYITQKCYREEYFSGNDELRSYIYDDYMKRRIEKYENRGFNIEFDKELGKKIIRKIKLNN